MTAPDELRRAEHQIPFLVATCLQRYRNVHPDRYAERLEHLLKAFEALVKMLAVYAAKSALLDAAPDPEFRRRLGDFRRPSLGQWLGLLRDTLKAYEKRRPPVLIEPIKRWFESRLPDRPGLASAVDLLREAAAAGQMPCRTTGELCALLVTFRNRATGAHGAAVTDEETRQRHDALRQVLESVAPEIAFVQQFPLAFVEEVAVKAGVHNLTLRVDRGREFELVTTQADEPLFDLRCYSVRIGEEGHLDFALDLSPFVVFRACPQCRTDQLFLFNGADRGIDYLSYHCGHQLRVADPAGELDAIERFLAGEISLHSLFHGKVLGAPLAGGTAGASREEREAALQLVRVAERLQAQELFQEALPVLQQALAKDEDCGPAHLRLGLNAFATGADEPDVTERLQRASRLAPDSAATHFANGRIAAFFGRSAEAREALLGARSLDPTNTRYTGIDGSPGAATGAATDSDEARRDLVRELLRDDEPVLPALRWWLTALPPWSWIRRRPLAGAAAVGAVTAVVSTAAGWRELSWLQALWFVNIGALVALGLVAPFEFARFLGQLFERLRAVVTLPSDTFRRWFLAEIVPFAGSAHLGEGTDAYDLATAWRRDRFHLLGSALWFVLFLPFQFACADGLDPFRPEWPVLCRYVVYTLEVYCLAWIPVFVLRALGFIPSFLRLPVRYFAGMPDAVSLKPVGTFYLKVSLLGFVAFFLFTTQHYLFRTYETVPLASTGFIVVCYGLFFTMMFASQAIIRITLGRLRERRVVDYSRTLESAFERWIREPSEERFAEVRRHQEALAFLKQRLETGGLTRGALVLFGVLTGAAIALVWLYLHLVRLDLWLG